jgi:hypothetical protein
MNSPLHVFTVDGLNRKGVQMTAPPQNLPTYNLCCLSNCSQQRRPGFQLCPRHLSDLPIGICRLVLDKPILILPREQRRLGCLDYEAIFRTLEITNIDILDAIQNRIPEGLFS